MAIIMQHCSKAERKSTEKLTHYNKNKSRFRFRIISSLCHKLISRPMVMSKLIRNQEDNYRKLF